MRSYAHSLCLPRYRGHPLSAPRGCGCRVRVWLAWVRLARSRGAARARVGGRPWCGGRGLPRYLRPRPPPRGEDALFRQLPGSSRAGGARECVAKAMGTILLILLAIVILPARRCPGGERRRRKEAAGQGGRLAAGRGEAHASPPQRGWDTEGLGYEVPMGKGRAGGLR